MPYKNKEVRHEYMRNSHANSISNAEIQYSIVARYDSGVSNYQKDRTGVLLKRIRKEDEDEQYIQALISRR